MGCSAGVGAALAVAVPKAVPPAALPGCRAIMPGGNGICPLPLAPASTRLTLVVGIATLLLLIAAELHAPLHGWRSGAASAACCCLRAGPLLALCIHAANSGRTPTVCPSGTSAIAWYSLLLPLLLPLHHSLTRRQR